MRPIATAATSTPEKTTEKQKDHTQQCKHCSCIHSCCEQEKRAGSPLEKQPAKAEPEYQSPMMVLGAQAAKVQKKTLDRQGRVICPISGALAFQDRT